MPYALEALELWLRANGYDGLVDDFGECCCELANLAHCDGEVDSCEAGHKVPCDCGAEHDWHMAPGPRPPAKP